MEQEERASVFHREQAGDVAATWTENLENADKSRAVVDATSSQMLIWKLHPTSVTRKLGCRFHFLHSCASHPKLPPVLSS